MLRPAMSMSIQGFRRKGFRDMSEDRGPARIVRITRCRADQPACHAKIPLRPADQSSTGTARFNDRTPKD